MTRVHSQVEVEVHDDTPNADALPHLTRDHGDYHSSIARKYERGVRPSTVTILVSICYLLMGNNVTPTTKVFLFSKKWIIEVFHTQSFISLIVETLIFLKGWNEDTEFD